MWEKLLRSRRRYRTFARSYQHLREVIVRFAGFISVWEKFSYVLQESYLTSDRIYQRSGKTILRLEEVINA